MCHMQWTYAVGTKYEKIYVNYEKNYVFFLNK